MIFGRQQPSFDPKILYALLLIITVLVISAQLTTRQIYGILSVFIMVVVAIGNISYLYHKS